LIVSLENEGKVVSVLANGSISVTSLFLKLNGRWRWVVSTHWIGGSVGPRESPSHSQVTICTKLFQLPVW